MSHPKAGARRRQARLGADIDKGCQYAMVYDFISPSGTAANLRGRTGKQGGKVVGAFVLTGHFYTDKLHFSQEPLYELLQ